MLHIFGWTTAVFTSIPLLGVVCLAGSCAAKSARKRGGFAELNWPAQPLVKMICTHFFRLYDDKSNPPPQIELLIHFVHTNWEEWPHTKTSRAGYDVNMYINGNVMFKPSIICQICSASQYISPMLGRIWFM